MSRIDRIIDRLEHALGMADLKGFETPARTHLLDEIDATLHPFCLPADLRRFWDRVIPGTLGVRVFPALTSPLFAFESYQANLEPEFFPTLGPPLLFPFAYSGHLFRSIELTGPDRPGGAIFAWSSNGGTRFRLQYHSFSDFLEMVVESIEERPIAEESVFDIPLETEEAKQAAHLLIQGTHPDYRDQLNLSEELKAWPTHWLHSAGIDLEDRRPRGATHTTAQVQAATAGEGPLRVLGRVTSLAGSPTGALAIVEDRTGVLDVWCPAGVSPWGPVCGDRFEFELTLNTGTAIHELDPDVLTLTERTLRSRHSGDYPGRAGRISPRQRYRPRFIASKIRPAVSPLD